MLIDLVVFVSLGDFVQEMFARSKAMRNPRAVTSIAEIFKWVGIVKVTGEDGMMTWFNKRPAMMLPKASRLIGLIIVGLFSLIEETEGKRGCCNDAKKITRRL